MKNIEFMKEYLEENLVKGRYLHTLGVVETAKSLAKIYGVDIKKAEIAALAHDIAKNLQPQELLEVIDKNNINLEEIYNYILRLDKERSSLRNICERNYNIAHSNYTEQQYINNMDNVFQKILEQ